MCCVCVERGFEFYQANGRGSEDQRHIWASSHLGHFDRIATVFWYLNDVAGGETVFPKHGQPICSPESKGGPKVRTCLGATDPATRHVVSFDDFLSGKAPCLKCDTSKESIPEELWD